MEILHNPRTMGQIHASDAGIKADVFELRAVSREVATLVHSTSEDDSPPSFLDARCV